METVKTQTNITNTNKFTVVDDTETDKKEKLVVFIITTTHKLKIVVKHFSQP